MVYTTWGMSAARVTVIDFEGTLVLDLIIKPEDPITDYNTEYSGITKDMVTKKGVSFSKVRDRKNERDGRERTKKFIFFVIGTSGTLQFHRSTDHSGWSLS